MNSAPGLVYRWSPAAPPAGHSVVMSRSQGDAITHILRGEAAQFQLPFHPDVAGKSGTTDNYVDAWFMTYTRDWVVAAWTGHTGDATETGMQGVGGLDVGRTISAPFVNSLPRPSAFGDTGVPWCPNGSPVPVGTELCPVMPSGHENGHGGGGGGD